MANKNIQQWSKLFRALANPHRLGIIKYLKRSGKTSVTSIAEEIGISLKNTSRNLRILHDVDIVESLGKSDHVFYSLNPTLDKEVAIITKFFAE